jgi:hypothetical protein
MLDKVNILMVDDQPSKLLTYEAIIQKDNGELGFQKMVQSLARRLRPD